MLLKLLLKNTTTIPITTTKILLKVRTDIFEMLPEHY